MSLIREIDGTFSPEAKLYYVVVHSRIKPTSPLFEETQGYYSVYNVIADNQEDALEYIRKFEEDEDVEDLEIHEVEILESFPKEPLGIFRCSARVYYEDD